MPTRDDIVRMRDQARRMAEEILDHPLRDAVDATTLNEIRTVLTAVEKAAAAPVRVGFAGGFSTGKSVLIGVLLGRPALLPSGQQATTGVITEIRPVLGSEIAVHPTVEVRYLDTKVVEEYRFRLIKVLRVGARRLDLDGPTSESWTHLTAWCRDVLWPTGQLEHGVRELVALRDAAIGYPWLAGRLEDTMSWDLVREALLTIDGAAEPAEPDWHPPAATPAARHLAVETMRRGRRLVERVTVTVTVPKRYWPLDRHQLGDDVVLIDSPGRGAAPSKIRDQLLLEREFKELDALIVMCDPTRPDASEVAEIRREYLETCGQGGRGGLTVINKFNLDASGDAVLESGTGAVTEADFLLAHPAYQGLNAAWRNAQWPTGDAGAASPPGHDVIIASVLTAWALDPAGDPPPVPCPPGTTEDEWRDRLRARAQGWGRLAARVPGRQGVAAPLAAYAQDGGMARLRLLTAGHAARTGLARKSDRVRWMLDELREPVEIARDRIEEWERTRPDPVAAARDALAEVINTAKDCLDWTRASCDVDVFTPGFTLSNGCAGTDELRRVVLADVYGWSEWGRLWDTVASREIRPGGVAVPVLTDELLPAFGQAVDNARREGVRVADAMIARWLVQRSRELASQVNAIGDALEPVRYRLGEHRRPVLACLTRAVQVAWLGEIPAGPEDVATAGAAAIDLLPLRPGHRLAWHPERPVRGNNRHQVQIARLRHVLAVNAVRAGHTALAARLRQRTAALRSALDDLTYRWAGLDIPGFLDDAYPRPQIPRQTTMPAHTEIPTDVEF